MENQTLALIASFIAMAFVVMAYFVKKKAYYQWCLGEGGCDYNAYLRDEKIRKRIHYHGSITTTINV